ncbi:MAG: gliding motility protein GldM [Bacteroidales bacterium]|nr:gliding motility protein GldM [Bacteroidales bacterium]
MGHGKETPRQKMIGMMYLVLTALLALNVSTSVLDAFKIIDEGLSKTQTTLYNKIKEIYSNFDEQAAINPNKVGDWKDKAYEVKEQSDKLYNRLQTLKMQVLQESEQKNFEAVKGEDGDIHRDKVSNTTDYDTPARIMIGEELTAKSEATVLKKEIEEYREFLLEFIPEENAETRKSIEGSLDTEPPHTEGGGHGGGHPTWEEHKFGHSPLMGFVAIMSSLQINVRNAESEVLTYLYSRIDASDFKFNELQATVIPNSSYILKGNKYVADVFIAARDTTKPPTVYVAESSNPYKEIKDAAGRIIDYQLRDDLKYETLPIQEGVAKYERAGSSIGTREWGGIIEITGPAGDPIRRPFKREYMVAEGSVVVSPTKMNVFYQGVDNPVKISVAGVPSNKVFASITNGAIERSGDAWVVRVNRLGNSMVSVTAEIDGQKREVGTEEFRVKRIPDPVAMIGGKKGGAIDKNVLLAQTGVAAVMENFDFDLSLPLQNLLCWL